MTGDTPDVPDITQLRQNPSIYRQREGEEWLASRPSTGMSSISPPSTADSTKHQPFLPAIDPRGSLSTRKNALNQRQGSRSKVNNVWASADSDNPTSSRTNGFHSDAVGNSKDGPIVPRPPSNTSSRSATRKGSGKSLHLQEM